MDEGMRTLVRSFAGQRVLVVGDVMLDAYVWGAVRRVSQEAPVPVVEVNRRTHAAGGAANAAVNVASLGGETRLGGVVGADPAAELLRAALQERGVPTAGLIEDRDR